MVKNAIRTSAVGITTREKPKGSGRWRLFFNKSGRTREIPGFTFKTEAAAEETAEKLRARLALGLSLQERRASTQAFDHYALRWLERVKRRVKDNTWRRSDLASSRFRTVRSPTGSLTYRRTEDGSATISSRVLGARDRYFPAASKFIKLGHCPFIELSRNLYPSPVTKFPPVIRSNRPAKAVTVGDTMKPAKRVFPLPYELQS